MEISIGSNWGIHKKYIFMWSCGLLVLSDGVASNMTHDSRCIFLLFIYFFIFHVYSWFKANAWVNVNVCSESGKLNIKLNMCVVMLINLQKTDSIKGGQSYGSLFFQCLLNFSFRKIKDKKNTNRVDHVDDGFLEDMRRYVFSQDILSHQCHPIDVKLGKKKQLGTEFLKIYIDNIWIHKYAA